MKKKLSLATLLLASGIVAGCGGGGLGGGAEGFYRISASLDSIKNDVCVIDYATDENGNLKSYQFTPDTDFLQLTVKESFVEKPQTPMPIFLEGAEIVLGNYKEYYPLAEEVTETGTQITLPLSVGAKIFSPLIYANKFEDQTLTYTGNVQLASQDLFWVPVQKSYSYDGSSPVTVQDTSSIKDVIISVDDTNCPVNSDGTIGAPCNGTVDFNNGLITINSVDSTALEQSHTSTGTFNYDFTGGSASFVLSENVEPNSVKVSVPSLGLSAVDDGNGNLTGDFNGTIDYDTGRITVSIPKDKLPYQETDVTATAGYSDTETFKILDLKAGTLKLTAVNGDQTVGFCTDNGNGELVGDCSGTVDYDTGDVSVTWSDDVSQVMANANVTYDTETASFGFTDTGTLKLKTPVKPLSFNMTYVEDGNTKAVCNDNGNGQLIGDCTGTIDYTTGDVSFDWNDGVSDSNATQKVINLSYQYQDVQGADKKVNLEYVKKDYQPVDLNFSWNSLDKNANLSISYLKKNESAPVSFNVTLPAETTLSTLKLYDGTTEIPSANYTVTAGDNGNVVVTLNDYYPNSNLTAVWTAERTFNWNPDVLVQNPYDVYTVKGYVRLIGKLPSGQTVETEVPITVTGQSCEETQNQ